MYKGEQGSEGEKYGILAVTLSEHVNFYTPSHWREPIQSVMPSFHFTVQEAKNMEAHFKQGDLKEILRSNYKNENVVDAIYSFFENKPPTSS